MNQQFKEENNKGSSIVKEEKEYTLEFKKYNIFEDVWLGESNATFPEKMFLSRFVPIGKISSYIGEPRKKRGSSISR